MKLTDEMVHAAAVAMEDHGWEVTDDSYSKAADIDPSQYALDPGAVILRAGLEAALGTASPAGTIEVRIPVGVTANGEWAATGWSNTVSGWGNDALAADIGDMIGAEYRRYVVVAHLEPMAVPEDVEGEVEEANSPAGVLDGPQTMIQDAIAGRREVKYVRGPANNAFGFG